MSFLYDEKNGCQFCGYKENKRSKTRGGIILIVLLVSVFALFLIGQSSFFSSESWGGKILAQFQKPTATVTVEPTMPIIVRPTAAETIPASPEIQGGTADQDQALHDIIAKIVTEIIHGDKTQTVSPQDENYAVLRDMIAAVISEQYPNSEMSGTDEQSTITQIVESVLNDLSTHGVIEFTQNNTPIPPDGSHEYSCNNQVSQFSPGMKGSLLPGAHVSWIRETPEKNEENTIDFLRSSNLFEVQDDPPVCADGYMWIRIKIISNGIVGWTVEGDGKSYWLVPLR